MPRAVQDIALHDPVTQFHRSFVCSKRLKSIYSCAYSTSVQSLQIYASLLHGLWSCHNSLLPLDFLLMFHAECTEDIQGPIHQAFLILLYKCTEESTSKQNS